MPAHRLRFSDPDGWESPAEGFRFKRLSEGPASLRLLEILSSAAHPQWCEVGHAGAVLEGALEIEFEDQSIRYEAGDGILIPPGPERRHRPKAISPRVRLALADFPSE